MNKQFKRVVDEHRHRIYTFSFYSLGNKEEAEDVTQEVLLRLWKHWEDIKQDTLPAWLTRVTRNACIDAVRRRQSYHKYVVSGGETEQMIQAVSNEPTPDTGVETLELRSQIKTALATLQEPYRSIVILREIQNMKYEQIGDTLDLPLNTVKSYLHRGRKMLRDQLSEALET